MTRMGQEAPRSVADIESFVTMLRVACEDRDVNDRLAKLLSLPAPKRRAVLHAWVSDLLIARAPQDFTAAIACLLDDKVAEKACELIFQGARPGENP